MVEKIRAIPSLPLYQDMFQPPRARLTSWHPVWSSLPNQKPSVTEAWQEEWTNSDDRNQFLIVNATARAPGSDLPRWLWSLLNRFRTGQGLCAANLHLWGLRADPLCECGLRQSITHIVEDCHLTRLQGGLRALHSADEAEQPSYGLTRQANARRSRRITHKFSLVSTSYSVNVLWTKY